MKSRKITKEMQAKIICALIVHTHKARYLELVKERAALAVRVRDTIYDKKTRTLMDSLPESFLSRKNAVRVYAESCEDLVLNGTFSAVFNFLTGDEKIPEVMLRVTNTHAGYHNQPAAKPDVGSSLYDAATEHQRKISAFRDAIKQDRAVASATIASVTTTKQLIEAWPEIKKYIPGDAEARNVVAIRREDLNARFKLP